MKRKYIDIVDDNMMVTYLLNNLTTSNDTTANLLCAAVYYILKNPSVWHCRVATSSHKICTSALLHSFLTVDQDTVVGMNPWVISRDKAVLGPEADRFIPERWLKQDKESKEKYQQRHARMQATDLAFGFGTRQCTGRHLSQLES